MPNKARIDIGSQDLLHMLLGVGENQFQGWKGGHASMLDIPIDGLGHDLREVQLARSVDGSKGMINLRHGFGKLIDKEIETISLLSSRKVSALRF